MTTISTRVVLVSLAAEWGIVRRVFLKIGGGARIDGRQHGVINSRLIIAWRCSLAQRLDGMRKAARFPGVYPLSPWANVWT